EAGADREQAAVLVDRPDDLLAELEREAMQLLALAKPLLRRSPRHRRRRLFLDVLGGAGPAYYAIAVSYGHRTRAHDPIAVAGARPKFGIERRPVFDRLAPGPPYAGLLTRVDDVEPPLAERLVRPKARHDRKRFAHHRQRALLVRRPYHSAAQLDGRSVHLLALPKAGELLLQRRDTIVGAGESGLHAAGVLSGLALDRPDPRFEGDRQSLGEAGRLEPVHHVAAVHLDGAQRDAERLGDFLVGKAGEQILKRLEEVEAAAKGVGMDLGGAEHEAQGAAHVPVVVDYINAMRFQRTVLG